MQVLDSSDWHDEDTGSYFKFVNSKMIMYGFIVQKVHINSGGVYSDDSANDNLQVLCK